MGILGEQQSARAINVNNNIDDMAEMLKMLNSIKAGLDGVIQRQDNLARELKVLREDIAGMKIPANFVMLDKRTQDLGATIAQVRSSLQRSTVVTDNNDGLGKRDNNGPGQSDKSPSETIPMDRTKMGTDLSNEQIAQIIEVVSTSCKFGDIPRATKAILGKYRKGIYSFAGRDNFVECAKMVLSSFGNDRLSVMPAKKQSDYLDCLWATLVNVANNKLNVVLEATKTETEQQVDTPKNKLEWCSAIGWSISAFSALYDNIITLAKPIIEQGGFDSVDRDAVLAGNYSSGVKVPVPTALQDGFFDYLLNGCKKAVSE